MITSLPVRILFATVFAATVALGATAAEKADPATGSIVIAVEKLQGRLEMVVHTSRILELGKKIPVVQVNDPEILKPTVLSPTQVQVSALKTGVTQVNLWDEDNRIYTVDVVVKGDAQLLEEILKQELPSSQLRAIPVGESVLINGFVQQPSHAALAVKMAEEFFPKVIDNVTVRGVHQVLLHVKTMEVSRTKLRELGFDWRLVTDGFAMASTPAGIVSPDIGFTIMSGSTQFDGIMRAMREDGLLKIVAEPTLSTISGRPATFLVGGKIPILVPQSLGTVSVEYEPYGTKIDFIPYVLDNDRIRLEVRPEVSEIDNSRSVVLGDYTQYAFNVRQVDTGVELKTGQTLAIAGLVQYRQEATRRQIPWLGELPYLGAAFRSVKQEQNEIELLILVTPEIVEAMDACEVPPCGPGFGTTSPSDWELFVKGHIEVPVCQTAGTGGGAGPAPCNGGPPTLRQIADPCVADAKNGGVAPTTDSNVVPATARTAKAPGFMGPVGYDELK